MTNNPDPAIQEMCQMIDAARRRFLFDAHAVLDEARAAVDAFADAVGEVSPHQALDGLRRFVDQKFREYLAKP
jgi:hypothetical protein